MKTLMLLALLPVAACHARFDEARLDDAPPDLAPAASGPMATDLRGVWTFRSDAYQSTTPSAVVAANSADAITVAFAAPVNSDCGCNAQHLVVALPRTLTCDATMSFDWSYVGDDLNLAALRIDFDPDGEPDSGAAGQFIGSTAVGASNCAWRYDMMHHFPKTPMLVDGHNNIALNQLVSGKDGKCYGSFNSIDIHVEGSVCAGGEVSASLSNLVFQ